MQAEPASRVLIRRLAPVIALLAVVATTLSLGAWQLRRAAEKDALQAGRAAARAAAPLALAAAAPSLAELDGRVVALVGRFDESRTILLDNRTRRGVAGFHVLTPLRVDDGGAWVMVLRGWVARDVADRTRLPALPALPAPVRVEGFAQAGLAQPLLLATPPDPGAGDRIWQRFDAQAFRRWSGLPIVDGVVRQTSETADGLERDWVEPGSGAQKHRGYAFQWFAMAATALVATAVIAWRARRRRRR
jgi:surfeit locus 1 family protein